MASGIRSGDTERSGYSLAGEVACRYRDVVGWGARIVGGGVSGGELSCTVVVGTWSTCLLLCVMAVAVGPVRMLEGRICSNPWVWATCSMDLKYWCLGAQS